MSMAALTLASDRLAAAAQAHEQSVAAINTARQVLQNEFSARQNGLNLQLWVNPQTGNNANAGTQAAPLATVHRAVELAPAGAILRVQLMGDLLIDAPLFASRLRALAIEANGVSFPWVRISQAAMGAFGIMAHYGNTRFLFRGVTLELPPDPPVGQAFPPKAMFSGQYYGQPGSLHVQIFECRLAIPPGTTQSCLIGIPQPHVTLDISFTTFVGGTAPFAGRLVEGLGGAGVNPATLAHRLSTNLTFI
jgi:hypothetical protein